MTIQDVISEVTEELERIVSAKTVIGTPIEACGKTIIPVTKVSVGFASGGYEGAGKDKSDSAAKSAYGGGGGAGAKIEPVAFIILTADSSEILTVNSTQLETEILKFLEMVPAVIDKVKAMRKERQPKSKIIEVDDDCEI
ncbi:GerW family sporulation protein [Methanolapillus millepedarum]|uniref:Spore protein YtfJ n=1 Tax=Methanolapillus millepedarum TaxID=3028296 RepID=A0AA96V5Z8_9EURY|nr:putative spore protein YtfJ [Methanosarcinaceae archaeon Ac7]